MTKIALITGASRGLGAALATALAPTHHIVAVARTTGALEEVDDRIRAAGGEATLAPMDISVDAAMQQLCRSIYDRWGGIALWVHTAAHPTPMSPAAYMAMKEMERATEVNLTATARLIGYVMPLLGQSGRAVFFEDSQGGQPFSGPTAAARPRRSRWRGLGRQKPRKPGHRLRSCNPTPWQRGCGPNSTRAKIAPPLPAPMRKPRGFCR